MRVLTSGAALRRLVVIEPDQIRAGYYARFESLHASVWIKECQTHVERAGRESTHSYRIMSDHR